MADELDTKLSYSVKEAAEATGLCEKTIRSKIRAGELAAAYVGTKIIIPRFAIEQWLRAISDRSGRCVRPDLSEKMKTMHQKKDAK